MIPRTSARGSLSPKPRTRRRAPRPSLGARRSWAPPANSYGAFPDEGLKKNINHVNAPLRPRIWDTEGRLLPSVYADEFPCHILEVWICDDGPLMITWARPFSNDRYHISLSPTNASHVQAQTARSARIAFATGYTVNSNLVPPGLSVQASGQCGLHERNYEPEFLTRDGVAWTDTALGALAPEGLKELMTRNPDLNQWYLRNKVF